MTAEFFNILAHIVLQFTHEVVIIPLLIIGYIWLERGTFSHAIRVLFLSMIFNAALKATFQIPLNPSVGKGFAFPSGHMQTAVVLYGYLYTQLNHQRVQRGIGILLLMIGASLIYCGYHNIIDIIGAVFFGILVIAGYKHCQRLFKQEMLYVSSFAFATGCLIFLYTTYAVPAHVSMAYYALIGFTMATYILEKSLPLNKQTTYQKITATLIFFGLLVAVSCIFSLKFDFIKRLGSLRWFALGVSIPLSLFLAVWIFNKRGVRFKRIK